jgi:hypothetical protein
MKPEVHRIRVNVKSLAAEARIIRKEVQLTRDPAVKSMLDFHRKMRVKPEARLAQLALAYARGVPYRIVESKPKNPPDAVSLTKKIERFMEVSFVNVKSWLAA